MQQTSFIQAEQTDSFKKKLFYKILMGLLTPFIGLIILAIVPRSLGPSDYGVYTYLFGFFTAYISFVEAGTSTCFYAKLSAKNDDSHLISFYSKFVFFVVIVSLFLIIVFSTSNLKQFIWSHTDFKFIMPMFFLGVFMWLNDIVLKACDATGATVQAETYRFIHRVSMLVFILGLSLFSFLNLKTFILFQNIFFFLYAYIVWVKLLKPKFIGPVFSFFINDQDKKMAKDFFVYSAPLFLSTAFFQIAQMIENWVLNYYAGSIEQGYFGLAMQFSTMALIFTSAVLPLVFKEFSVAASKNDFERAQQLFQKSIKQVPFLAMVLSIFLAFNGSDLAEIFAGSEYKKASLALSLMLLYPIHQAYGQLCNVSFFAFGKTKIHMMLSFFSVLISLPLAFFLMLPQNQGGLFLGSFGQALKYLIVQFIITNSALFFACRICKLRFINLFTHQISSLSLILILGYLAKFIAECFFVSSDGLFLSLSRLVLCGSLYLFLIYFALLLFPNLIDLNKNEMNDLISSTVKKIRAVLKG